MARPHKWRKVCSLPVCTSFKPEHGRQNGTVTMTVDEYETIRLIDLAGLTQIQCAEQMDIARTSVQAIYASARKKLASCIVNGMALTIGGGSFELCERRGSGHDRECCRKRQNLCPKEKETDADV